MTELAISRVKGFANVGSNVLPVLPESWFKSILRQLHYKYTINKALKKIVKQSEFELGVLYLELKNGLKFQALPSTWDGRLWSRYVDSEWTDKWAELQIFWETYGQLIEQFIEGIYERNCRLQEGDTIIDVGASWGFNTVDFSRKVGDKGKVVAIEPNKRSVSTLRKNLELNGCNNVMVVEKGAWSRKGRLKFNISESPGRSSLVTAEGRVIKTTEVEVDTLDNILEELGIGEATLIKMDIAGAEIEALKGMDRILSKDGVKLAIASYHTVDSKPTHKTLIPMMEKKGFSSYFEQGILYFANHLGK